LKVKLSRDKLKSALRDDPEFRVFARYWSGSLRFDIGDDAYLIKIKDGEVNAVDSQAPATSGSGDVVITAPADDWAEFFKPLPDLWYHEFYPDERPSRLPPRRRSRLSLALLYRDPPLGGDSAVACDGREGVSAVTVKFSPITGRYVISRCKASNIASISRKPAKERPF
jgi:hypothetical protein